MDNTDSRLYVDRNLCGNRYEFYFMQRNKMRDTIAVAQPLTLESHEHAAGMQITKLPTFSIPLDDKGFMQHLMDEMWNLGIRPSTAKSGDDLINALNSHLDDMRTISFHKLGIGTTCSSK